jgi:hypothetical protein
MTQSLQIGRSDGGYNGAAIVPAVATTQSAAATVVGIGASTFVPVAGSTAVTLPLNPGTAPVVITNNAATAVSLLVFPAFNPVTVAGSGGILYGSAVTPAANGSITVPQGKSLVAYPLPNGIDFIVTLGA